MADVPQRERVACTTYYKPFLGSDGEWRGEVGRRSSREDGSAQKQDISCLWGWRLASRRWSGATTGLRVQGIAASRQLGLPLRVLLGWPQGNRSFSMIMGLKGDRVSEYTEPDNAEHRWTKAGPCQKGDLWMA